MKVFAILLQVAGLAAVSITTINKYVGDTVELPSGAKEQETLLRVDWSVFSNSTLIASYSDGVKIVEWFYQFKGRLSMNSSTGNLKISNLTLHDALVYKVDLFGHQSYQVHKVKLVVKERFQEPAITAVGYPSSGGRCFAVLLCRSPVEGVTFSWHVGTPGVTTFNHTVGRESLLQALISSTLGNIQINCTARKDDDHAHHSIITDCPSEPPTAVPPVHPPLPTVFVNQLEETSPSSCQQALVSSLTFIFGIVLGIFLTRLWKVVRRHPSCDLQEGRR